MFFNIFIEFLIFFMLLLLLRFWLNIILKLFFKIIEYLEIMKVFNLFEIDLKNLYCLVYLFGV